jgi:hypothetical protein
MDRLAFALLSALHLAGCLFFFPLAEITSGEPVLSSDYVAHFLDGARVAGFLRDGSFWDYSTRWAAGAPAGFLALVNGKPYALLLAIVPDALHPLAFNLLVLALLFAFPPLVYATARELGLERREAALAMLLAIVAWYGSGLFRIFWRGGSVIFPVASAAALWIVARLHRQWTEPLPKRTRWLGLAAAAALLPWFHPVAMAIVLLGGAASWLVTLPRRGLRPGTIVMLGAVVLAANAAWLWPHLAHADLRRGFDYGSLEGAPRYLLFDLVTGPLHLQPWNRGEVAVLGPFVVAAVLGWRALADRPDLRRLFPLLGLGLAVLAYGAGRISWIGVLQPHRFAMPLTAWVAIAAAAAPRLLPSAANRRGRALATVAALLFAALLADRIRAASHGGDYLAAGISRTDAAALGLLRTHAADAEGRIEARVLLDADWRSERIPGRRLAKRVSYAFAALEGRLDAEWIGAPVTTVGLWQDHASFWQGTVFGRKIDAFDKEEFLAASEIYDVGWIVTIRDDVQSRLDAFAPEVEPVAGADGVALYRVRREPTRVWRGQGRAHGTGTAIELEAAAPGAIVLKYHWIPGLAAEPPAAIRGVAVDPTSPCLFVEIDAPAAGAYRIGLPSVGPSRIGLAPIDRPRIGPR